MITTNAFDYINVLDKAADASWLRETAIMNNLANTDTPGYKRQEVDFESVLQRELGHSKYTTLDKKIRSLNADLSGLNVSTHTDSSNYSYRLELASETIRYQALTNSITSDFTRMQAVLK